MHDSISTSNPMFYPIFVFSIFVFILFVFILSISVSQYLNYKVTDGTASCSEQLNNCLLKFEWKDSKGEVHTEKKVISYENINQSGVFSVQVAYKVNNDNLDRFLIIGSPWNVYLGTTTYIIVYSILSFLSLLVILMMIPFHKKKSSKK